MAGKLSREQFLEIVTRLCNGEVRSEKEVSRYINLLKENVSHPGISDLIFWSEPELTPEQITDIAWSHKPASLLAPDH